MTNRFIFSNHNKFFDDIPSLTLDHESGTFFVIYYSDIFMFVYGFIPDKTKNDYDMIAIYSPNLADVVFEMKDTFWG